MAAMPAVAASRSPLQRSSRHPCAACFWCIEQAEAFLQQHGRDDDETETASREPITTSAATAAMRRRLTKSF